MAHGVTGNTSDFGSAESRFEPEWANKKASTKWGLFLWGKLFSFYCCTNTLRTSTPEAEFKVT